MRRWSTASLSGLTVAVTLIAAVAVLVQVGSREGDDPDQAPETDRALPPDDEQELRPQPTAIRSDRRLVLRGPDARILASAGLEVRAPEAGPAPSEFVAQALYFQTQVYASAAAKRTVRGILRRGTEIPIVQRVSGPGCEGGTWYSVAAGGYVCTKLGVLVTSKPKPLDLHFSLPDVDGLLPYRYSKVIRQGAERMYRVPTLEEDKQIAVAAAGKGAWPEVVEKPMEGVFFFAIHELVEDASREFYSSVRGRHVRKEDVKLLDPPAMHGQLLGKKWRLPLAIVFDKERPVYKLDGGRLVRAGTAAKHARFNLRRTVKHDRRAFAAGPDGVLVPLAGVRIARTVKRPDSVGADDRWIHVNLSSQTLVAYQGSRPVFATAVSSGKKGFEPPLGLFRIHQKFVSATMNGPDPDDGWYEVEEVPWTMYYWESYALHGTYWHNDFGKPRSHGCTNIAPADARWLFHWTSPGLPAGWHGAMEQQGTAVYFTK